MSTGTSSTRYAVEELPPCPTCSSFMWFQGVYDPLCLWYRRSCYRISNLQYTTCFHLLILRVLLADTWVSCAHKMDRVASINQSLPTNPCCVAAGARIRRRQHPGRCHPGAGGDAERGVQSVGVHLPAGLRGPHHQRDLVHGRQQRHAGRGRRRQPAQAGTASPCEEQDSSRTAFAGSPHRAQRPRPRSSPCLSV